LTHLSPQKKMQYSRIRSQRRPVNENRLNGTKKVMDGTGAPAIGVLRTIIIGRLRELAVNPLAHRKHCGIPMAGIELLTFCLGMLTAGQRARSDRAAGDAGGSIGSPYRLHSGLTNRSEGWW
jgi:hypothetical protein